MARVNRRRTKRGTADRIRQPDSQTAHRNRPHSESSNRQTETDGRAAKRKQQSERCAAKRQQTARQTANGKPADCHVADRDDAFRNTRAHRDRIDARADVNQRPGAKRQRRTILEAHHRWRLKAVVADDARAVSADALMADGFLTHGANADGRHAIVVEAIHGVKLSLDEER